jgi:hypothetical protein
MAESWEMWMGCRNSPLKMPFKATRRVSKGFLLDEFTSLSPLLTRRVTFSTGW